MRTARFGRWLATVQRAELGLPTRWRHLARNAPLIALSVLVLACSSGTSSTNGSAGKPGMTATGGTGAAGATGSGGSAGSAPGGGSGGKSAGGGTGGVGGSAGSGVGAGAGGTTGASAGAGGTTSTGGIGTSGGMSGAGGTVAGTGGSLAQGGEAGTLGDTPTEKALAKLPQIRQEHSVVALNGEVYVIGGYTPGNGGGLTPTDSVIAYDPTNDSWRSVKSFPGQLNHGNAGVLGGKIYVGGFYSGNSMTASSEQSFAYDPTGDAWTEVSPLPQGTGRGAGCVAVVDDQMYVVGGASNGKSVAYASRYDAVADEWEALPDLPERKEHCAAGAIGGIVYVVGGRVDGITTFQPKSYAFDPKTMMWSEKAAIITPRGGLAGAVLGSKLYVFGGEGNSADTTGVFPDIDAYDPAANSWAKVGEMLIPRHGYGAAVIDDKVYLPGGANKQGGGASDNDSVFWLE